MLPFPETSDRTSVRGGVGSSEDHMLGGADLGTMTFIGPEGKHGFHLTTSRQPEPLHQLLIQYLPCAALGNG